MRIVRAPRAIQEGSLDRTQAFYLVACIGIDLGMLDSALQHLPEPVLRRSRWLVASRDARRLISLHDLWNDETDIVACFAADSFPREAVEIVLERERREREVAIWVQPEPDSERCEAAGPTALTTILVSKGATSRQLAALLENVLNDLDR